MFVPVSYNLGYHNDEPLDSRVGYAESVHTLYMVLVIFVVIAAFVSLITVLYRVCTECQRNRENGSQLPIPSTTQYSVYQ